MDIRGKDVISGILFLMDTKDAGYREIEHTADWSLQVWAPDLNTLFEQAALGMNELSETELEVSPRHSRKMRLDALDDESLLVAFLNELVFIGEYENLGFDSFEVMVQDHQLSAQLSGAIFANRNKEIKAVTYHNLEINSSPNGFEVEIVFDV